MGCGIVRNEEGEPAGFICGDSITPCDECGTPSDYQCDWPIGDGKRCDLYLCGFHACEVGHETHFCPIHLTMYRATNAHRIVKRGKLELVATDSGGGQDSQIGAEEK